MAAALAVVMEMVKKVLAWMAFLHYVEAVQESSGYASKFLKIADIMNSV